jgi:hypothetical protein
VTCAVEIDLKQCRSSVAFVDADTCSDAAVPVSPSVSSVPNSISAAVLQVDAGLVADDAAARAACVQLAARLGNSGPAAPAFRALQGQQELEPMPCSQAPLAMTSSTQRGVCTMWERCMQVVP